MHYADTMMRQLAEYHASRAEELKALWAMSAAERQAAMWRGELSGTQLMAWARRRPHEVPTINGEWAFIAALTPEIADANDPVDTSRAKS